MGDETKGQEVTGQDQVTKALAEQVKEFGLCLMDFNKKLLNRQEKYNYRM